MKFLIKGLLRKNVYNAKDDISNAACYNLMRKSGYIFRGKDETQNETIFIRPLERGGYPRFHIYLKIDGSTGSPQGGENLIFNLHLDQKRPIYKGVTAHSGEYEGEIVEKEAARIKQFISAAGIPST